MNLRHLLALLMIVLSAGCASSSPDVPYPAFVQADELPDVFLAGFPGIRAKQFAGNPQTRRTSNRLLLPANWSGSTGGDPSKSLELFVLGGSLQLGEFELTEGGYAWLPAGWSGANISTESGATLLYFLNNANPASVIQTPLIASSHLIEWRPASQPAVGGLFEKELRHDPGTGARTWLLRIAPGTSRPWQRLPGTVEGYLLAGRYRGSECVAGRAVTAVYSPGGYFYRPAGAVFGGPEEAAVETATWLLRTGTGVTPEPIAGCSKPPPVN
ncbi:MAG: DUF4437 domain-containing protein [Woeseia sp.]